jgi:hypothetical protein
MAASGQRQSSAILDPFEDHPSTDGNFRSLPGACFVAWTAVVPVDKLGEQIDCD